MGEESSICVIKQAENYDQQHQKFRNYEKEFNDILHGLSIDHTKDLTFIDLACGTGATSIYASKYFKKIYPVDVSEMMINKAMKKAEHEKLTNIEFHNAGFLSYEHQTHIRDEYSTFSWIMDKIKLINCSEKNLPVVLVTSWLVILSQYSIRTI